MVAVDFAKKYGAQEEKSPVNNKVDFAKKYGAQEEEEPTWKSAMRYGGAIAQPLAMIAGGAPNAAMEIATTPEPEPKFQLNEDEEYGGPWGGNPVVQMLKAKGLSDQDINNLFEQAQQGYEESSQQAAKFKPSVSGAFSTAEEMGLPIEPKTLGQKALQTTTFLATLGKGGKFTNPLTPFQLRKTGVGMAGYAGLQHAGLSPEAAQQVAILGTELGAGALHTGETPTISQRGVPAATEKLFSPGEKLFTKPSEPSPISDEAPYRPSFDVAEDAKKLLSQKEAEFNENLDAAAEAEANLTRDIKQNEISAEEERIKGEESAAERSKKGEKISKIRPSRIQGKGVEIRVKSPEATEDVGYRPADQPKTPKEESQQIITNNKFPTSEQGGEAVKKTVNEVSAEMRKRINGLYDESDELNNDAIAERPEVVQVLQDTISELQAASPSELSFPEQELLRVAKKNLKALAKTNKKGKVVRYKPVSNTYIGNIKKRLNQVIDYTFEHGDKYNIFKPMTKSLDQSILATESEFPEAVEAYQTANKAHAEWADIFNDPNVKPFRNTIDRNYTKLLNKVNDVSSYREINRALSRSKKGAEQAQILKQRIVDDKLGKFFDNPKSKNMTEFTNELNELSDILSPFEKDRLKTAHQQAIQKREALSGRVKKPGAGNAKEINLAKKNLEKQKLDLSKIKAEKAAKHWQEATPETIFKEMDTISGIRKMEHFLKDNPEELAKFQKLKQEAGIYRLYNGKVRNPNATRSISKVLEDVDNVRYLEETLGKDTVQQWQKTIGEHEKYEADLAKYEKQIKDYEKAMDKADKAETKAMLKGQIEKAKSNKKTTLAKKEMYHFLIDAIPGSNIAPHLLKQALVDYIVD